MVKQRAADGFGLPREVMLKKKQDIREVLSGGKKYYGKMLNIFIRPSTARQFAVLVPKRIGKAVWRNRMKRLAREIYRQHPQWFKDKQVIFSIKGYSPDFRALSGEVKKLVAKHEIHSD